MTRTRLYIRCAASLVIIATGAVSAAEEPDLGPETRATLLVPPGQRPIHLAVPWPHVDPDTGQSWTLREPQAGGRRVAADRVPAIRPDGSLEADAWRVLATIPPGADDDPRVWRLTPSTTVAAERTAFRIEPVDERSIGIRDRDGRPVLVYNHGFQSKPGVPSGKNRGSYVHPIYGLDGEVLTDDFPEDHLHHRGLFWTWPHVGIDGEDHDLWLGGRGIEQRFERWLAREAGHAAAVLGVENGWYVGDRKVMHERVWLTVYPAIGDEQAIDVACYWTPIDRPVTLAGAEGKSYGGLTLRFAPRTGTTITTPQGPQGDDLLITRLPWADLTARFEGAPIPSGAAIFISRDHPDFPPEWLTRHYGLLCVGWPGVEAQTLQPDRTAVCRYRVWIHRGAADVARLEAAFAAYGQVADVRWEADVKDDGDRPD